MSVTWVPEFGVVRVIFDRPIASSYEQDPPFLPTSAWNVHGLGVTGWSYDGSPFFPTGVDIQTNYVSGPAPTIIDYTPNFSLPAGAWIYTWAGTDPWPAGPFLGPVKPFTRPIS